MANLDSIVIELKAERDRLDNAIEALSALSGAATGKGAKSRRQTGKRTMSAAARARIAAAQKARWARARGQKAVPIASKGKRRISPAGIARIRAAARARWARVRAGKK